MGEKLSPQLYFETPGNSTSLGPPEPPLGARGLALYDEVGDHPSTFVFRSESLETAHSGDLMRLFYQDWYFRVHFIPTFLNFGTFSQQTIAGVGTWSAFPTAQNLTTVTLQDPDTFGVTYASPTLPVAFAGFQVRTIFFTASNRGADIINDIAEFDFEGIGLRNLQVTGLRVQPPPSVLWPYKPNWNAPLAVTREWRTDIISSRNGREQRRSLRTMPRRRVSFENVVRPSELLAFQDLTRFRARGTFILPDYTRNTTTVDPVSDSLTAEFESIPFWVFPDAYVVFERGTQRLQRLVRSVAGNVVTFWESDGLEWPAGTRVYPGLITELEDELSARRILPELHTLATVLNVVPGQEVIESFGTAAEIIDGREVFSMRANWRDPRTVVFARPSELLDFGYGVNTRTYPQPTPKERITLSFTFKSQDDALALHQFVGRMRGRQGAFYMRSGQNDLTIAQDLELGPDFKFFRTLGADDLLRLRTDLSRRAVEITLTSGEKIVQIIESLEFVEEEDIGYTQFNVRDEWAYEVDLAEIESVSWLVTWRLSSDTYDERWSTQQVCEAQLTIETIPREDADVV